MRDIKVEWRRWNNSIQEHYAGTVASKKGTNIPLTFTFFTCVFGGGQDVFSFVWTEWFSSPSYAEQPEHWLSNGQIHIYLQSWWSFTVSVQKNNKVRNIVVNISLNSLKSLYFTHVQTQICIDILGLQMVHYLLPTVREFGSYSKYTGSSTSSQKYLNGRKHMTKSAQTLTTLTHSIQ